LVYDEEWGIKTIIIIGRQLYDSIVVEKEGGKGVSKIIQDTLCNVEWEGVFKQVEVN